MTRSAICCDTVAVPSRRALLAAMGAAALLPAAPVRAAGFEASLADLVNTDGAPSSLARSLPQDRVSVRGYLSPSLDGRAFDLTEQPPLPCQLCGATHDAGASLPVSMARPETGVPTGEVLVSGRLELEPVLRLADARIGAA